MAMAMAMDGGQRAREVGGLYRSRSDSLSNECKTKLTLYSDQLAKPQEWARDPTSTTVRPTEGEDREDESSK
jgi:hypothetical protein